MQRHIGDVDAHGFDLYQKLFGKMESRGGRGGAAQLPGINRLIALRVLQLLPDIGRQRHLAEALQYLKEDPLVVELDDPVAALRHLQNRSSQFPLAEKQLRARLGLSPGAAEAFPFSVPQIPQQHQLHAAAAGATADEAGGQHPGIVQHQAVTRLQIAGQIVKMPVLHRACMFIQMQES